MPTTRMWLPGMVLPTLIAATVRQTFGVEVTDKLIIAQILVESGGKDNLVGDKHLPADQWAYGCLQIRQVCVDDVNHHYGTDYKSKECLGNRGKSILIYKRYLQIYATRAKLGHEPTDQDRARIWNGGPVGWKRKVTLSYWRRVQLALKNLK